MCFNQITKLKVAVNSSLRPLEYINMIKVFFLGANMIKVGHIWLWVNNYDRFHMELMLINGVL